MTKESTATTVKLVEEEELINAQTQTRSTYARYQARLVFCRVSKNGSWSENRPTDAMWPEGNATCVQRPNIRGGAADA